MPFEENTQTLEYLSWRKLHLSRVKLKASSKTSALLSGFAMVALVELQFNVEEKPSSTLLIVFVICTMLLISVHMLALVISTCILPYIETVSNLHSVDLVQNSPHEQLHWYIETAWVFLTVLGLLLFLLEIGIICAVKFNTFESETKSPVMWLTCAILVPVVIIFVAFAAHFYRTLLLLKCNATTSDLLNLELIKKQIEPKDRQWQNGRTSPSKDINIF